MINEPYTPGHILQNELEFQEDGNKYLGEFQIVNLIGEGTFGKVLLGIHKRTQEKVAIKLMSKRKIEDFNDSTRINREIGILKLLSHAHIVRFYQLIDTPKTICLVMEYCTGKDLLTYLKSNGKIKEIEAAILFSQLISAIDYLSKFGVSHRDIKLDNILVQDNKIKLIDFGLSNRFDPKTNSLLSTSCGSPSYAAPEIILGEKYDGVISDLWSCGVVLYALVCAHLPFEATSENELFEKIVTGQFKMHKYISPKLQDLLNRILVTNPNKRITLSSLKNHSFIRMHTCDYIKGIIPGIFPPIDYEVADFILKNERIQYSSVQDLVSSIIENKRDELTTFYYLLVKRKVKGKFIFEDFFKPQSQSNYSTLSTLSKTPKYNTRLIKANAPANFNSQESISDFESLLFKAYFQQSLKAMQDSKNLITYHTSQLQKKLKVLGQQSAQRPDTSLTLEESNMTIDASQIIDQPSVKPNSINSKPLENLRLICIWFVNSTLSQVFNKVQKNKLKLQACQDLFNARPILVKNHKLLAQKAKDKYNKFIQVEPTPKSTPYLESGVSNHLQNPVESKKFSNRSLNYDLLNVVYIKPIHSDKKNKTTLSAESVGKYTLKHQIMKRPKSIERNISTDFNYSEATQSSLINSTTKQSSFNYNSVCSNSKVDSSHKEKEIILIRTTRKESIDYNNDRTVTKNTSIGPGTKTPVAHSRPVANELKHPFTTTNKSDNPKISLTAQKRDNQLSQFISKFLV